MKNIYVDGGKLARNGQKTAIRAGMSGQTFASLVSLTRTRLATNGILILFYCAIVRTTASQNIDLAFLQLFSMQSYISQIL